MKQVTARAYEWSQYEPAARLDANGHFVQARDGQPGALVNPVALQPGDREHIIELGGVAGIVLTSADVADAEVVSWCAQEFNCPVWLPQGAAAAVSDVCHYRAGDELPGGLTADEA